VDQADELMAKTVSPRKYERHGPAKRGDRETGSEAGKSLNQVLIQNLLRGSGRTVPP
jgi:hypothetical protein